MGPVPVLRSCLVQLIHQQTPGTVCHFVCSAEDYSQLSKIILNFKLFKKSSPRTYQGTRGGQEHKTKDSKHHVLVRKNKILPLLNHFSAAFQIYIKLTSLSKKSGIKNWTQVQPFGSWTKCFQSWNSEGFHLNGNLILRPVLKYFMNLHIKEYHYALAYRISRK